ncbi:hypothetical protein [Candidatus Symbiopectobacterium sp. NZEC135]|uniref:hypothetical protein n=1 Tax=Candidatus Symbiopectobacterium sp. NZEC135 TaxID=2820471 RepID=UPI002225E7B3|nr:hypothetical protein [Candidatus Symbiopectobacterium sp. NZEC135]MCW2482801.1 hypothetical protein [Candidatus Symbiopectobacterium sp. NZEC135]
MNSLPLHHTCYQENPFISATINNHHSTLPPAMMTSLNKINNSSLNLYDGSVVERSGFLAPSASTAKTRKHAATTCCHFMHVRAISNGDAASHCQSNSNLTVSGSSRDIQHVVQTGDVLSHIDESAACSKMRTETVKRSALFVKNLSSTILMLSRAGIDIPDGISPHTIYFNYTREKRKAEQLGYHFNRTDFQHRINCKAKERLPGLIKEYYSSPARAEKVFSALQSRSVQQTILQYISQNRQA